MLSEIGILNILLLIFPLEFFSVVFNGNDIWQQIDHEYPSIGILFNDIKFLEECTEGQGERRCVLGAKDNLNDFLTFSALRLMK